MVKTTIENYTFIESDRGFSLSYKRSRKDNIFTVGYIISALFFAFFGLLLFSHEFEKESISLINIAIISLFPFSCFIACKKVYISSKTTSKPFITRKNRQPYFTLIKDNKKQQIQLDELNVIEYQMISTDISVLSRNHNVIAIEVLLSLKGGKKIELFDFDLIEVLNHNRKDYEKKLKKEAKKLCFLLANNLDIELRWKVTKKFIS